MYTRQSVAYFAAPLASAELRLYGGGDYYYYSVQLQDTTTSPHSTTARPESGRARAQKLAENPPNGTGNGGRNKQRYARRAAVVSGGTRGGEGRVVIVDGKRRSGEGERARGLELESSVPASSAQRSCSATTRRGQWGNGANNGCSGRRADRRPSRAARIAAQRIHS